MTLIADIFVKLRTAKNVVRQSLVSDDPSTSNMVHTVTFWTTPPSLCLFIIVKVIELQKVSFSAMENLKTVC